MDAKEREQRIEELTDEMDELDRNGEPFPPGKHYTDLMAERQRLFDLRKEDA